MRDTRARNSLARMVWTTFYLRFTEVEISKIYVGSSCSCRVTSCNRWYNWEVGSRGRSKDWERKWKLYDKIFILQNSRLFFNWSCHWFYHNQNEFSYHFRFVWRSKSLPFFSIFFHIFLTLFLKLLETMTIDTLNTYRT